MAKAAEPLCSEKDGVGAAQLASLFLPMPRDEGGAWRGQPAPHAPTQASLEAEELPCSLQLGRAWPWLRQM